MERMIFMGIRHCIRKWSCNYGLYIIAILLNLIGNHHLNSKLKTQH
jgi:hypothetical protein